MESNYDISNPANIRNINYKSDKHKFRNIKYNIYIKEYECK